MAEPSLAVRRKSRPGSARKRSRAPVQPSAVCSPVARKRPSSGGEGPPAETPVRGWRDAGGPLGLGVEAGGLRLGGWLGPDPAILTSLLCMRGDAFWL